MKTFHHYIQHLMSQRTSLGSLIAKALQSEQTKKLINSVLPVSLQNLITDSHVEDGIVTLLCSTAEKATLVRFESIDLLSALRQYPILGHIKKIQVRVVPSFQQTQNTDFTTGNNSNALKSVAEVQSKTGKITKISRLTAEQFRVLAESIEPGPGSEELKESLRKLAARHPHPIPPPRSEGGG